MHDLSFHNCFWIETNIFIILTLCLRNCFKEKTITLKICVGLRLDLSLNFCFMYSTIVFSQTNFCNCFHFSSLTMINLTINFNLTQFTMRKLWIIAWIDNFRSALVVVNDVTCMKWALDSLVLWWRTYSILYFMETKMAVVLWSCIRNIQGKPCKSRCECRWSYGKKWSEEMKM